MARSPVTKLIDGFHSLNEVEQKVFLDQVDPQPEQEAPAKKTRKKRTPRTGLPEAAKDVKADAPKGSGQFCTAIVPGLGVVCGETADKLIHDPKGGYGGYHPFSLVAPVAVPRSQRKSRSLKAAESSTANSEIETATVTAVGASGD